MNLYNTLSKTIEPFNPTGDTVSIYVCGVTPYDTTHLGHAFTYTINDVLIRYLESQGKTVRYVQNVTDIDDDILRKAAQLGEDWRALGNRWTAHFITDLITLNVRPPDYYPRATSVIPEIVEIVSRLLASGVAYEMNGSVYYDVHAWDDFGALSGMTREQMLPIANERGNRPDDPNKRHPLDFVLWQAQAPGEPAWESPWGPGRPGWHIECSTMSTKFLGETLDLHSGGGDLVFPHHECEIAQIEPVTGKRPFVRIWLHIAMVRHLGEKMSKSLGNLVMVRDLLKTYTPDAIRFYLADHHYRQPWEYDEAHLARCAERAAQVAAASLAQSGAGAALEPAPYLVDFQTAMDADLNTAAALQVLDRLAEHILAGAATGQATRAAQAALQQFATVFGLRLAAPAPEARVQAVWQAHLADFA